MIHFTIETLEQNRTPFGISSAQIVPEGDFCMKLKSNIMKSKTKFVIALCTVLAMSACSLVAEDQEKDKSQGGTGSQSKLETGTSTPSGQLSRSDEKFVRDAAKGGMMEVHMGKMGTQQAQ